MPPGAPGTCVTCSTCDQPKATDGWLSRLCPAKLGRRAGAGVSVLAEPARCQGRALTVVLLSNLGAL